MVFKSDMALYCYCLYNTATKSKQLLSFTDPSPIQERLEELFKVPRLQSLNNPRPKGSTADVLVEGTTGPPQRYPVNVLTDNFMNTYNTI